MSVRKAFKALIMRDYDTTNITLIRQLIKMVGSDYRSACRNRRQKQIYWLNNNQARDTTMKNLWKRRWQEKTGQEKTVSLRPWWRPIRKLFALSASLWKYGEPKAKVGTLCGEHGVSAFLFFLHHLLCCLWILSTRGVASEQLKITKIPTENTRFPI